jgi:hypothetical protein
MFLFLPSGCCVETKIVIERIIWECDSFTQMRNMTLTLDNNLLLRSVFFPPQAILSLYAMSFGCMLCCFELRLKSFAESIAKNFGFMYKPHGRITFLLLCSFLMLSLGSIMSYIVGAYVLALVPANVYILMKYPTLEKQVCMYVSSKFGISSFVSSSKPPPPSPLLVFRPSITKQMELKPL